MNLEHHQHDPEVRFLEQWARRQGWLEPQEDGTPSRMRVVLDRVVAQGRAGEILEAMVRAVREASPPHTADETPIPPNLEEPSTDLPEAGVFQPDGPLTESAIGNGLSGPLI